MYDRLLGGGIPTFGAGTKESNVQVLVSGSKVGEGGSGGCGCGCGCGCGASGGGGAAAGIQGPGIRDVNIDADGASDVTIEFTSEV